MEHRQLNFDVSRGGIQHRLFVRVGDLGSRTVVSRFHARGEPIEVVDASIRIKRPDKTEILGACSVENGEVAYTFTGGEDTDGTVCDLAVAGEYECEYILYGAGGAVMTSPCFIVTATDVLFDGEGAESSDSYKAYIAALMKLQTGNFTVTAVEGKTVNATVEIGTESIHIALTLPRGKPGEPGKDYILTDADKREIAGYAGKRVVFWLGGLQAMIDAPGESVWKDLPELFEGIEIEDIPKYYRFAFVGDSGIVDATGYSFDSEQQLLTIYGYDATNDSYMSLAINSAKNYASETRGTEHKYLESRLNAPKVVFIDRESGNLRFADENYFIMPAVQFFEDNTPEGLDKYLFVYQTANAMENGYRIPLTVYHDGDAFCFEGYLASEDLYVFGKYKKWVDDTILFEETENYMRGKSAEITATAESVDSDAEASVTRTVTEEGVQFHFLIPEGPAGDDGYSPIRGTDYWTDADKAEIKSYVDEAILGGAW